MKRCTSCKKEKPETEFYTKRTSCKDCLMSKPVRIEPLIYQVHFRRTDKVGYFALVMRERGPTFDTIQEARKWREKRKRWTKPRSESLAEIHKDNYLCRPWV